MPRRNAKRKYKRKRKNNQQNSQVMVIPKNRLMPDRLMCKLSYTSRVVITSTLGTPNVQTYRANSLHDPDLTGLGLQPVGHDQYKTLYNKYKVFASKINLKLVSLGSTPGTSSFEVALFPAVDAALSTTDPQQHNGNPRSKFTITGQAGRNVTMMSNYVTVASLFGKTKAGVAAENDFGASIAGNPTSEIFWNIAVQTLDQISTGSIVAYSEITYYVQYEQPGILADV